MKRATFSRQKEFSELAEPHLSSLYSTAMRMTRNNQDAEDLVQDTLYKAYRALNQFQKNTNFRAWIFKILVNTFITGYRKAVKQPKKVSYEDIHEFILYKGAKIDESLLSDDSKVDIINHYFDDEIKAALENLPYQFRLVVLLCDIEGFSYNEIAHIIDVPLGTVMSRLYRRRRLLQRTLWDYAKEKGYVGEHTRVKK